MSKMLSVSDNIFAVLYKREKLFHNILSDKLLETYAQKDSYLDHLQVFLSFYRLHFAPSAKTASSSPVSIQLLESIRTPTG